LVGYPDGCVGPCVNGKVNSYTALASIARQSGGKRLFVANDPNPAEPVAPAPPRVDSVVRDSSGVVRVSWSAPDNGGSPILSYNVYRRTDPGTYVSPLSNLPAATLLYEDVHAYPSTDYFFILRAIKPFGERIYFVPF